MSSKETSCFKESRNGKPTERYREVELGIPLLVFRSKKAIEHLKTNFLRQGG